MAVDEVEWSVEEVLPILRQVSLFEGLPDDDLRKLAEIARGTTAEEGEILFEEGEAGHAFYVVFEGAVEILKAGAEGEEKLAIRRAGEGFGEMALIDDSPRSATARVVAPTRLILIDRESFRDLLEQDRLATRMLEVLARALRALNVRFAAQERGAPAGYDMREVSRLLQRGLLPRNAPKVAGYDIAAGTSLEDDGEGRTAWDAIPLEGGDTALVSLLVRGDGFPPAHYLAVARALLREVARSGATARDLLERANEGMADATVEGMNQYVECGLLVPTDDGVVWSGAGRTPAAVLRHDGNYVELQSHGPPLGMMGGFRYGIQRLQMAQGDVALVLSEASKGLFRGAADLVATLEGKPVREVVETVHRALRRARGGDVPETSVLFARRT
ncbi:MAG: cyclic nucleotide-binding domain-containing protein [Longimicrobiales bacterium]|nr:cyclic nucleotide-binding domain-containing protein [Longimicrobiales bacterium]